MSEDASTASASASAPEVATACMKKRGRPPANKTALKLVEMTRLRRWEDMSSDPSISKWLLTYVAAKEVFLTSERTTCKVCLTRKQFVKMSDTRALLSYASHNRLLAQ